MRWMTRLTVAGVFACLSLVARAENTAPAVPTTKPATDIAAGPAINTNCIMEPDKAIDKSVFIIYKGQKIGFCCEDCVKDFKENPEKYIARFNEKKK